MRPLSIGSPPLTNTIGIVEVAARAACIAVFWPTITATCRCARSAASAVSRSNLFSAQRNSIATLWPSMNPDSFRPRGMPIPGKRYRQPWWHQVNRSPVLTVAAPAPSPATPPLRRRASPRIFGVQCGLPCDPPAGGHSCNGGMIPHFHRCTAGFQSPRCPLWVRNGHHRSPGHVRFTPQSGQIADIAECPLSANGLNRSRGRALRAAGTATR